MSSKMRLPALSIAVALLAHRRSYLLRVYVSGAYTYPYEFA